MTTDQATSRDRTLIRTGVVTCFLEWGKQGIAAIVVATLIQTPSAVAADRTEFAISALEFGGSVGKLLWQPVKARTDATERRANQYTQLASEIKAQIDTGRISSSLLQANMRGLATALTYFAVAGPPEPLSKAVAGVAAWGAKKTGDELGQMVIEQSQTQARSILARGLQNSGLSEEQLKNMTKEELRAKVADLKVGGQTLRETLKDDPESLGMLQANAVDIATKIGIEALSRSQGTAADVKTIQQDLAKTTSAIDGYQKAVQANLVKVESRISGLEAATITANKKLDALSKQVAGQSKAMQTLAQVSSSGWSTAQKLQAVQSGLFPDLTDKQKNALVESLTADQAREGIVTSVQQAAQSFGDLSLIAKNLGLPGNLVTGLHDAQTVATGIDKFASGDTLGAVAALTSLVGLATPDAAAERHKEMIKFIDKKFEEVNKKLDIIIDIQIKTLKALDALATQQQAFQGQVLGQLDRIESTVLGNQQLLQAILLSHWRECAALINRALGGEFEIPTRRVLVRIVTLVRHAEQEAAIRQWSTF